ncbi:MAG: sulfatase-like hydrolase/transferase, partial [Planctomycetota bacterium]
MSETFITRRKFLRAMGLGATLTTFENLSILRANKERKRPNILLITADDMNWDSPGCFGGKTPDITPNIDRLTSEGMRFHYAHITIAVCQPCRSVLMTGRYPHRNGAEGFEPIDTSVPILQEKLHEAGYLNGILGKVPHLAPANKFKWNVVKNAGELGRGRDPQLYYKFAKS